MDNNEQEYSQVEAQVRQEHSDWWNRSWLPPLPEEEQSIWRQPAFMFHWGTFGNDEDAQWVLVPVDNHGAIPSHETWRELVEHASHFYSQTTPDEIDIVNWKSLIKQELRQRRRYLSEQVYCNQAERGFVYLLRGGPYYKIGVSNDVNRRMEEITPRLPFETELVCTIATEDMYELEADLHDHFADKRTNGEWFELSGKDVEYIRSLADG